MIIFSTMAVVNLLTSPCSLLLLLTSFKIFSDSSSFLTTSSTVTDSGMRLRFTESLLLAACGDFLTVMAPLISPIFFSSSEMALALFSVGV